MAGIKAIITHTDLDGVASAALILRAVGNVDKILFAQPHQLHAVLGKIPNGSTVYIADLGVNPGTLEKVVNEISRITNSGGSVRWFDHHVWDNDWVSKVKEAGADLAVDITTCGAGVVAKYFPVSGEGVKELVSATCSIDLWLFNDWRGNYLAKYVGHKEGGEWREYVARKLVNFNGEIDDEVESIAEEAVSRELRLYSKVVKEAKVGKAGEYVIAYYLKPRTEHVTSYIGNILLSRHGADIALICREGSLSLRSRNVNVREIAKKLGGGGHPAAAGAPIRPPLLILILAKLGLKSPLLNWCFKKVAEVITEGR